MGLVYLDDAIIFSKDNESHFYHLDYVITLLKEGRVKLNVKKCFSLRDHIDSLSHVIHPGILSVSQRETSFTAADLRMPERVDHSEILVHHSPQRTA